MKTFAVVGRRSLMRLLSNETFRLLFGIMGIISLAGLTLGLLLKL